MNITRRLFFQRFSKKSKPETVEMPIAQPPISFRSLSADPMLGEVMVVPYNFAPRGWAFCQGQLLPIAQNTALFSLLGTMYGGDGRTTFALPNLNSRAVMGAGRGPGLSDISIGETGGISTVTLTTNQLPATVSVNEVMVRGTGGTQGVGLAKGAEAGAGTLTAPQTPTAVNNMPPFLGLNYVIALQGIYPPRS